MTAMILLLLLAIGYTYLGYPMLLQGIVFFKKRERVPLNPPLKNHSVTVVIAAHNEEQVIGETIKSILASNFPQHLLHIWIISDASTDNTDAIVTAMDEPRVKLVKIPERGGKVKALRHASSLVTSDLVIIADASGRFHSTTVSHLLGAFQDPTVGSVVGRKCIMLAGTEISKSDSLYQRYDSWLRYLESQTGNSYVGCEGGLTALRRELFRYDFSDTLAEDYALGCRVYEAGYRNIFSPEAIVYEQPSQTIQHEFRRKIRVIVRGIQAFLAFGHLLNPIRHPRFFFQNISHRLMRWCVPFFLISLLLLTAKHPALEYQVLFLLQCCFYGMALMGFGISQLKKNIHLSPLLSLPTYFTSMNLAALVSWFCLFKRYECWTSMERNINSQPGQIS